MLAGQPTQPDSGVAEGVRVETERPPAPERPVVDGDSKTIKAVLLALKAGPMFILLLMVVVLWVTTGGHVFMSYGNIGNVLEQSAGVCIIALGQLLVILTRGIDLSIGSNISLVLCCRDRRLSRHAVPVLAIGVTLLIGLTVGLVNGLLLVKGRLPHPFIATLATLSIGAALALYIAKRLDGGRRAWIVDKLGGSRISQVPGAGDEGWFPFAALVVIVFAILCWVILRKLVWGRWIYAVGGSPEAAERTGVPVNGVLISVYVIEWAVGCHRRAAVRRDRGRRLAVHRPRAWS